ncbi:alpha/beta hydrolase family protein [Dankookia sp. P2]|uniref:alpha/beta hydrolase family protein n=1 Tax=Dankookia sp. P2 TaxID=3423955 RepID=UPI003D670396
MPLLPVTPRRRAVALLLAALGGCAGPAAPPPAAPGFSADTATREGLISGAAATEPGCAALPDALWVRAGDRAECLRFGSGGFGGEPARRAIVYIPGDPGGAAYRTAGGRPQIEEVSPAYELSDAARHAFAQARSAALGGIPVLVLGRPGMQGSSGDHAQDRHTRAEVALVDAGLTALRQRFGIEELVLLGFSSGGAVVANLLPRRDDIACAVIGSAPLDLKAYYRRPDGSLPDGYAMRAGALADPLDSIPAIRPGPEIYVIGDRQDRMVPAASWTAWVAAAQQAGLQVHAAQVAGLDRPDLGRGAAASRHLTASRGFEVARACATGMPPDQVMRALQAGATLLVPRGRRLHGAEIRAALAGRRLRGLEWEPAMNVLSAWGADGTLTYFSLGRVTRPLGQWRWRVEGDRLCTTRHGCTEVLADAGALHLVSGHPAQLRLTLLTAAAAPDEIVGCGSIRPGRSGRWRRAGWPAAMSGHAGRVSARPPGWHRPPRRHCRRRAARPRGRGSARPVRRRSSAACHRHCRRRWRAGRPGRSWRRHPRRRGCR